MVFSGPYSLGPRDLVPPIRIHTATRCRRRREGAATARQASGRRRSSSRQCRPVIESPKPMMTGVPVNAVMSTASRKNQEAGAEGEGCFALLLPPGAGAGA